MKAKNLFFLLPLSLLLFSLDSPKALRAYFKKEILPVLRAQRLKLEPHLSQADKDRIAFLRKELKFTRGENQAIDTHSDREKYRLEAASIAFRNFETIKALFDEIEPQRKIWKQEIEKMLPQEKSVKFRRLERVFSSVGFLLMDVEDSLDQKWAVRVFPNPSSGSVFVEYELMESATVLIEVFAQNGVLVSSQKLSQTAGNHKVSLVLQKGNYLLKLSNGTQNATRRLIVD
jgi:hypothetical protein